MSPLRKHAPYGRPVHRLGDCAGRSPGSRVVTQVRPAFPVAQWPYDAGSPLTVAGGAPEWRYTHGIRVSSFLPAPQEGELMPGRIWTQPASRRSTMARPARSASTIEGQVV